MKTFKEVGASEARKNPGKLLSQVFERREQVLITRSGKPVAALVPVDWLERWWMRRERFFKKVEPMQLASATIAPSGEILVLVSHEGLIGSRRL